MAAQRKVWRKNLYENADYEDNYTDPTFLKDLRTNLNVKFYTLGEAVHGVTFLSNQISCITGFLITFFLLYTDRVSPTNILLASGVATIVGYTFYSGRNIQLTDIIEDSKTLLTMLIFSYIFSPLLHTLTDAISTDTIMWMTFLVMILNLIFFDYGLSSALVSKAISLNAAIFGSICLSSRLSSSYHAFVLLVVAAIFFVLYPIFTTTYWESYFLIPISFACCFFLYQISMPVLYTYIVIILFVNFICPWIFVNQQKHKNNIHGPWDEAIVGENDDVKIEEKI